jgi:hypothetical protein
VIWRNCWTCYDREVCEMQKAERCWVSSVSAPHGINHRRARRGKLGGLPSSAGGRAEKDLHHRPSPCGPPIRQGQVDLPVPSDRPVRPVIEVMVAQKRDLASTRRFLTAPLITGRPRSRSPLIARPPTRGCSMSWPLAPVMSPSNTETTRSKLITDG